MLDICRFHRSGSRHILGKNMDMSSRAAGLLGGGGALFLWNRKTQKHFTVAKDHPKGTTIFLMNLLLFHLLSIIFHRIHLAAPQHTPCPTVPVKHARPRFKTSFAPAGLKEKRGPTNQCEQSRKTKTSPRAWWIFYVCGVFSTKMLPLFLCCLKIVI